MSHARRLAHLAAHLSAVDAPGSGYKDKEASPKPAEEAGTSLAAIATAAASRGTSSSDWHQQCFAFEPGRLLLGQVAIVTGAGGGIGRAVSLQAAPLVCGPCGGARWLAVRSIGAVPPLATGPTAP